MLLGFRAGEDAAVKVSSADFAATRRAWNLPAGTAPLARVFPDGPFVGAATPADKLVKRLNAACLPVIDADMVPFPSFKPDVGDVLAGQLDKQLAAVGRWIRDLGRLVYLTVHHEPENDSMDGRSNLGRAQNFRACFEHCYEKIKAVAGDRVVMGPVHMAYHWRNKSETTQAGAVANAWRVAADHRDFVALDAYTSNWSLKAGAALRDKPDVQRWRALLDVPDDEVLLAERGITRNPRGVKNGARFQAETLADDIAWLTELGAHGLMYWNSGGATDDSLFLLGAPGRELFRGQAIALA